MFRLRIFIYPVSLKYRDLLRKAFLRGLMAAERRMRRRQKCPSVIATHSKWSVRTARKQQIRSCLLTLTAIGNDVKDIQEEEKKLLAMILEEDNYRTLLPLSLVLLLITCHQIVLPGAS